VGLQKKQNFTWGQLELENGSSGGRTSGKRFRAIARSFEIDSHNIVGEPAGGGQRSWDVGTGNEKKKKHIGDQWPFREPGGGKNEYTEGEKRRIDGQGERVVMTARAPQRKWSIIWSVSKGTLGPKCVGNAAKPQPIGGVRRRNHRIVPKRGVKQNNEQRGTLSMGRICGVVGPHDRRST